MRFIVSDHIEGSQSFGKWKYTCFGDVRTWSDGERLCLWFGYGIAITAGSVMLAGQLGD